MALNNIHFKLDHCEVKKKKERIVVGSAGKGFVKKQSLIISHPHHIIRKIRLLVST